LAGDIGTLVAVTHHAGSWTNGTFYAHHNHRGDIVLTRSGTTTVGRYDYTAFGTLKSQTGPDVCRFNFSSKERDASTGFSYYGYRFYAPQWQRWACRDPIAERTGAAFFSYAANNPIVRIDPDGRVAWQVVACVAWIGLSVVDLYREFKQNSCWGLSGGDFLACVLENVARGILPGGKIADLLKCIIAGVSAPGSAEQKMDRAIDCVTCFGLDAIIDLGKTIAAAMCIGPWLNRAPIADPPPILRPAYASSY
jgi:RHS repeat-associated protein